MFKISFSRGDLFITNWVFVDLYEFLFAGCEEIVHNQFARASLYVHIVGFCYFLWRLLGKLRSIIGKSEKVD